MTVGPSARLNVEMTKRVYLDALALGAKVFVYPTTSLALGVQNLTNELYSEFANASFFRPEPGRNVSTSLIVEF